MEYSAEEACLIEKIPGSALSHANFTSVLNRIVERKMKDLDNFRYLPIDRKAEILENEGKYICTVYAHGLKITLYGWEGVFAEVFTGSKNQKLVAVRLIEDRKRLSIYSRHCDLRTLLDQSITCILLVLGPCFARFPEYFY